MIRSSQSQLWLDRLATVIGSSLFGVSIKGFTDLSSTTSHYLILAYAAMGFIGMFLVFLGLRR
jgi:hypothetical protein